MGKRKESQNNRPLKLRRESNALLPARLPGEDSDPPLLLPYIKRENNENLESLIVNEATMSPVTMPLSYVKQEPPEFQIMNIQEGATSNTNSNTASCELNPPILNDKIKEESIEENNHASQFSSAPSNDHEISSKKRASIELKRKKELDEKLEIIRKRIKMETEPELNNLFDQSDSIQISPSVNNTSENNSDFDNKILENDVSKVDKRFCDNNENFKNISDVKDIDNDILVLPTEKPNKNVEVICISDSEEDKNLELESASSLPSKVNDQNIPPQNPAPAYMKEKDVNTKFSTDILKFFNVSSKLDRYDCYKALEFFKNYKTDNPVEIFFPKVKKETKTLHEIREGDFLFAKVGTIVAENIPTLTDDKCNISRLLQHINFHINNTNRNKPIIEPTFSVLQNFISMSQSGLFLPSPSFNQLLNLYSVISSVSNSQEQLQDISVEQSNNILENCFRNLSMNNLVSIYENSEVTVTHPDKIISKSPDNVRSELNLRSRDSTQAINAEIIPFQSITSQPLHTFQNSSMSSKQTKGNLLSSYSLINRDFAIPLYEKNLSKSPHDDRSKLNSKRGSNIHVCNNAILPSQSIESQPLHDFQKSSISSSQTMVDVSSFNCSSENCDPRLATKVKFSPRKENERNLLYKNCKVTFPPRKGSEKDLLLYQNCGKNDISDYFEKLVLQWNPEWLDIQKLTNHVPPIFEAYPCVATSYKDEEIYYNTYVPLHLLHVWFIIFEKWCNKNRTFIHSNCISVEKTQDKIKIMCFTVLGDDDNWPESDDIVWCKHKEEEAFLRVEDVKKKPSTSGITKLKISLESLHDLKLQPDDSVDFLILFNIRNACLETRSLKSYDNYIKDVILKPEKNSTAIAIVQLQQNHKPKEQRNEIIKTVSMSDTLVCLIQIYHTLDRVLLITQVAYVIAYGMKNQSDVAVSKTYCSKLLICLKNEELLPKLFRRLIEYKPVLIVRTKQMKLEQNLVRHTLEDRLENKENLIEILNNNQIFITTFSAFSTAEKQQMSKINKLACLVDEAHICSELETALFLSLKLKKLLLIGDKSMSPYFNSLLRKYRLDLSLFARLFEAKTSSC